MKPTETWKKNKWRPDLRLYTRNFQKSFESKKKISLLPGEVYAAKYRTSSDFPTDKHHFTPLFISFGRFRDEQGKTHTRGLNLFYLKNEQKLEILDEVFREFSKKPDARVAQLIKIHEKWMKIAPYAFKNFEESRIIAISEVSSSEWGMIPLLKDYLFGTFNSTALNEDFQKEITAPRVKTKVKNQDPQKQTVTEEEENEVLSEEVISLDFDDDI